MCCSAVNDGSVSPWVMCSSSVVRGNQIRDRAPPKSGFQTLHTHGTIQEGGGVEVETGGRERQGQGPCGPMRTGAHQGGGRKRQQRREVTLAGRAET